jgi:hypothetical protein
MVLSRELPHFQEQGNNAHAIIVVDTDAGTAVSANVYSVGANDGIGGRLGKNYDPETMTQVIPAGEEFAAWLKGKTDPKKKSKAYEVNNSDFDGVVELATKVVTVAKTKKVKVTA